MSTETHDFTLRQVYDGNMYALRTNESVDINGMPSKCLMV